MPLTLHTADSQGPATAATLPYPVLPPLHSLDQWKSQREVLREEWTQVLGPCPDNCALAPETISREDAGDHTRLRVRYMTEPGARAEAFLLVPKALASPAPAAVVFHATTDNNILQPVGLADDPTRHLGFQLVRRGFVVLCPRNFIYGYGENLDTADLTRRRTAEDWRAAVERLLSRHPRWTGMGKMLWDAMRSVDYLSSLPEVNRKAIASVGHSLGGKEALYLHSFDERIAASIASEAGIGMFFTNWNSPWYLGSQVNEVGFSRNHHELLALAAPRPFLLIGGGADDGTHSWPYIRTAGEVYSLYDRRDQLALLIHSEGHTIPHDAREAAFDWLEHALPAR
jgi:hypothetical protein